ncbi:arylsulfatase [Adhaeribacter aerolatus]|uniref:Arylsulfatase n=1 Tax=Adhaeribacter aerolatus TaxID=670289 RepID=A0A512B664_9BACT|nr:arylsulfatase [Adhaeribacter aerolatus]GEO07453.1 arylsulfatase [Adhaeribacter aerolatus]
MYKPFLYLLTLVCFVFARVTFAQQKPNIVIIYADDLGYGDVSSYGATKIKTPNIDKLATQGLRFTQAYATSATCTPSRFSMLTGKYAWRKQGTGIAPGDAALLIPTDITTLPGMLQKAGYKTAVVGKWHLGLGPQGGPDWNQEIKPGPLEIGFNYSFILPATGDRVPCVYMENRRIVDLDPADPIRVSYKEKIGNEPTGKENPELLKMKPSHGHDNTIVNGVSRIGYMTGGKKARWIDEEMADVITNRAINFIDKNKTGPFFLYFATQDIHVPRMPHSRFVGKSGMGARGDAILQLDWTVGEVLNALDKLNLAYKTIVLFSSDNGPVLDDGYDDKAVSKLGGHKPAGSLRGGKYSAFEASTRVPFLVRWPGTIKPGVSAALISQVDLFSSFAQLTGQTLGAQDAPDSFNVLNALLGKAKNGREYIVSQALNNTLSLVQNNWKYIEPSNGPRLNKNTNTELGNNPEPQLYNLKEDISEARNVAKANPKVLQQMQATLKEVKEKNASRQL